MSSRVLLLLICATVECVGLWAAATSSVPASSTILSIVSATNYRTGRLASESIAVAFGAKLATGTGVARANPLPGSLAGTRVQVQDSTNIVRTAPLLYASPGQVNFQIPSGTAPGKAFVTVQSADGTISAGSVEIAAVSPGLFSADSSGTGVASALLLVAKADGTQSETPTFQCDSNGCKAIPVDPGGPRDQAFLELFGSGIRGRSSLGGIICTIDGVVAPVRYAGPQPTNPGLDQVNVELPRNLRGEQALEVSLTVDSHPANTLTIVLHKTEDGDTVFRASRIVSQMSLSEKIQQLHGIQDQDHHRTVPGVPRLGIPALNITNGPAGVGNGGPGHEGPATALPAPISLAATWDVKLAKLYGSVIGLEARYLANGLLEGPDINISRVPQNGRTFEAFGEDPFLVGQIAVNTIEGIQSEGVIAEAKHYAGNNQETDREIINDVIDERTLREVYLPAFESAVKKARVGAVMCAYNKVNGAYNCENDFLQNEILKTEWGFDGFITSDFGAVHSTVPSADAGLDLEMPTGIYFDSALQSAVQSRATMMPAINDKLVRRFATMMRLGVFDNPPTNQPLPIQQDGAIARQIAAAGMVLLKNSGVLPLDASALRSIAVVGPFATAAKTGGGGSAQVTPAYTVDPIPGIQARLGPGVSVHFAYGHNIDDAVSLARSADAAVVMVGDDQAEGADHSLALNGTQDQLIAAVAAANPRTVVVVKSGGPVLMPWANDVPTILQAWYPGEEDGNAVAAVLFGDVNPSGKLPITFPRSVADAPASTPAQYPGVDGIAHYSEGVFVGYRHGDARDKRPLFPFGHGLSYTKFSYQNLALGPESFSLTDNPDQSVTVEFDITNSGSLPGAEVSQLYLGIPATAAPQPPKQLKGFQKLQLQPGQTGHVQLLLDRRSFSYWDVNSHGWQVAPGNYRIMVGSSSRDIRLQGQITIY